MKTVRIRWTYHVIGALLVLSTFDRAKADTVLAQNGPHAAFNAIPFSSLSGTGRYQEVYSSSLFGGPVLITSLAFSPSDTTLYSANVDLLRSRDRGGQMNAEGCAFADNRIELDRAEMVFSDLVAD